MLRRQLLTTAVAVPLIAALPTAAPAKGRPLLPADWITPTDGIPWVDQMGFDMLTAWARAFDVTVDDLVTRYGKARYGKSSNSLIVDLPPPNDRQLIGIFPHLHLYLPGSLRRWPHVVS